MINVKDNFKNMYQGEDLLCDLKCGKYEDQQHLLECEVLLGKCTALYEDDTVKYEDLFKTENKQLDEVKLFNKVLKTRDSLLEEISTRDNLVQCTS